MSEHDLIREHLAGALQRVAHVAKEEKFGRRYTVGMRSNPPLADINPSTREELTQVIVGPAITKPEFEDIALQALDQTGREIEASALRFQPAYEAVEPAHDPSGVRARPFAQSPYFVERGAELKVG